MYSVSEVKAMTGVGGVNLRLTWSLFHRISCHFNSTGFTRLHLRLGHLADDKATYNGVKVHFTPLFSIIWSENVERNFSQNVWPTLERQIFLLKYYQIKMRLSLINWTWSFCVWWCSDEGLNVILQCLMIWWRARQRRWKLWQPLFFHAAAYYAKSYGACQKVPPASPQSSPSETRTMSPLRRC